MLAAGSGGLAGPSGGGAGVPAAGSGVAGMVAAGTGSAGMPAGGCGTESFAAIYRDIFENTTHACSSPACHGRVSALASVGNLDLSTPAAAYAGLVGKTSDSTDCSGKPRVIAGNPDGSMLVRKLRESTLDCGTIMPAGSDPITDPELMRIATWIRDGACNN